MPDEEATPDGAVPGDGETGDATVPGDAVTAETPADAPAATDEALTPPIFVPRVVVPRWIQAVILPLAIIAAFLLARAAGSIFLVVLIAAVVALILNPLAKLLEHVMPRGLSILCSYIVVILVFAGIGFLLADPVATQISRFSDHFPQIVRSANRSLDNIQSFLNRHGIKVQIEHQGETALDTLEHRIAKSSGSIVSFSRNLAGKLVTFGVDVILTLVLSVYLLVYGASIGRLVRRWMPPGDGTPSDDYPLLVQKAVSGYVRGQLLFSVIMGASAGIGLWLFGITGVFPDGSKYAVFFAVFYGLMEFIPYIGPILGPIPPVLVALLTHPISAVWLVILFVLLQQLEGHIVAPQVFRISLRINPILVILALLVGYQLYGVPGALVALPIATVVRQTVLYLRRHLELESWGTPPPSTPPD